ncbi:MAG: hypothetical protein AVDCRST_MAG67-1406, partial [uncultured Solirubrobacteraceae bacterium]
ADTCSHRRRRGHDRRMALRGEVLNLRCDRSFGPCDGSLGGDGGRGARRVLLLRRGRTGRRGRARGRHLGHRLRHEARADGPRTRSALRGRHPRVRPSPPRPAAPAPVRPGVERALAQGCLGARLRRRVGVAQRRRALPRDGALGARPSRRRDPGV